MSANEFCPSTGLAEPEPLPWNPQVLLARAGRDEQLAAELLEIVVDTVPDWLDELAAAVATCDWPTIQRHSHSLKSTGDNLGATVPRDIAAAIERAAQQRDAVAVRSRLEYCIELWTNLVLRVDESLHAEAALITVPVNSDPAEHHAPTKPVADSAHHKSNDVHEEWTAQLGPEMLAHLSHELRTPMTAILGFTEALLEDRDERAPRDERRNALKIIRRNGEYLLQLINNILDLSKIEAGRFEVERVAVSLSKLLSDMQTTLQLRAHEKQLAFSVRAVTPVPETIQTDPLRVQQILMNLVGNAIKFTERGSITVDVGCSDPASPSPRLVIDVIDTGIGMTPAEIAHLFRPFQQAGQWVARRYGGTGLGLTISRHLARLLGGDIEASSEPQVGSRFRLTITTGPLEGVPLLQRLERVSERTGLLPMPVRVLRKRRILLAEDQPDNRLLISRFLTGQGAEVVTVDNGADCVRVALDAEAHGTPFQLILMDVNMPVLDGLEATRRLRHSQYLRPIIALTAAALSGQREACLSAGCTDYATKPINREELLEKILGYTGKAV